MNVEGLHNMTQSRFHIIGRIAYFALPEPENRIAAFGKVGILRSVNTDATVLTLGKYGEFVGMGVPIIAIELNNDAVLRNEGVHTELTADHGLRLEVNARALHDLVSSPFKTVDLDRLLIGIHSAQHGRSFGIFVSAFKRAVDRIGLRAGWRPTERLTAYLTGVLVFIASLPRDLVFDTAKESRTALEAARRQVELVATPFAIDHLSASLRRRNACRITAIIRAIAGVSKEAFTAVGAVVVFASHTAILAQTIATIKPVQVSE